ncbi:hypothetical protein [Thermococcus sp.]|uniref:hypothetical protein n=1 Tax=Thermococcus sp. TaxID=35749 RepID=UPI0025E96D7C|nr:hypothetical protein [Thermococcus sp.]
MRNIVYYISLVLAAVALFWPLLYARFSQLGKVPGDPSLQALLGLLLFGALAYATHNEEPTAF